MQTFNTYTVAIVIIIVLALVVFIVVRNNKDRKKLITPSSTDDAVKELQEDKERNRKNSYCNKIGRYESSHQPEIY